MWLPQSHVRPRRNRIDDPGFQDRIMFGVFALLMLSAALLGATS